MSFEETESTARRSMAAKSQGAGQAPVIRGTYREDRSYDWNYDHGPVFETPWPSVPRTRPRQFLGFKVNSRLGIAAGLLLNSRWIDTYARLGFDILTYKTVRSVKRKCYPKPNWLYIPESIGLERSKRGVQAVASRKPGETSVTSTVSFGMPSKSPEVWMADVARARSCLATGQVLIVSVVATPSPGQGAAELVADFARLAAMAREAGAHVVEANLSCPNVCTAEGDIYQDAELSGQVARAMRAASHDVPVLLKVGYLARSRQLESLLRSVSGHVNGVVLVNGLARPIYTTKGGAAFGKGREVAGILGRGIHEMCVSSVTQAVAIRDRLSLDLEILGVGGVASEAEAARYLDAGAAAAMMGSAPMYDPLLAVRLKSARSDW